MPYKITRRDDITGAISYGCAPWRVNLSTFPSSDLGFHRGNFLPAGTVLFRIGGSITSGTVWFWILVVRKLFTVQKRWISACVLYGVYVLICDVDL
jgi:hypothetical protein